ncbi:uncharacterized protein LTR77_010198 [Saxophila tyrrhenica]|uniref:Uncharacterized protein n=1 Tax=Saxophila tyrrhenica TaxID=1690608 RepID=A0AAV9NW72_9PEZI|nr:hypothetical protein LTR77_010198 [Saxophila tyrrhenica]
MAPEQPTATANANSSEEADLAKAFQELAKGERTATALENQLNSMEARIEALLAQAEREKQEMEQMRAAGESEGSEQDRGGKEDA